MKKGLSVLMGILLIAGALAGCGSDAGSSAAPSETSSVAASSSEPESAASEPETPTSSQEEAAAEPVDVNIMALKGPTAMGMVKMMSEVDAGELSDNNYQFTIAAAVDEVTPKLVQGETDIAAVPANLASVLYNNTEGQVEVLAINTLGVIYIVESGESVSSVEDLRGKTIYASGKGATPEYALNYILRENGIDPASDVTIEWKSEHTECLTALMAADNAIAMLPQPFVTTAQTKSDKIRVALDLTEEWDKLQQGVEEPSALLTGVVVARKEFVDENPEAVKAFLEHYRESVEYVNANTEDAANLVGEYGIVTADVAVKALPACNIVCIEGEEMKEKLSGYLQVLFEQNPASVGGAMPEDAFYYAG